MSLEDGLSPENTSVFSTQEKTDGVLEILEGKNNNRQKPDDTESGFKEKANKANRRNIFYITLGSIGVLGLFGSILFLNPFGGQQIFSQTNTEQSALEVSVDSEEQFAKKNPIPFDSESWQEESYRVLAENNSLDESYQGVVKQSENNGLDLSASILPSEAAGYTSDLSQEFLADGTYNPMFSYWTKELFERETGLIVERLSNPLYGQWQNFQYSEYHASTDFNFSVFNDIFVAGYEQSHTGESKQSWIPVFADWGENDYGMSDVLLGSSRWFGLVTSSTTEFSYDDNINQYTAVYTAKVTFTAWTKEQTTVSKAGTLTLHLVPAISQSVSNGSSNRVLVSEANLVVD